MTNGISPENTPTSSNRELPPIKIVCFDPENPGHPCPICGGVGLIRYDVDIHDTRFGKLFRCPNNPVELDEEHQERLRKISNLDAFPDKTFENFETNPDDGYTPRDQESLKVVLNVAHNYAQTPKGWLLLEGSYGCGKTHLAAAVGNHRLQSGDAVLFITTPDLLDHLRSAYSPTAETGYDETFERVRNAPLLILDDLGVENPSPWAKEKLFQILNHRYSNQLPTVITTNANIDELDPRIRSRLIDTQIVHRIKINAPDYRNISGYRSLGQAGNLLTSSLSAYIHMTFENFNTRDHLLPEERKNLERALKVAMEYARKPAGWFILTGDYGVGKTHLAAAIAQHRKTVGDEVVFVTVPDLLDYLRQTFNPNTNVSFDQRFQIVREAQLLVLDDLATNYSSEWVRQKLFQILDYRYVRRLPTVITLTENIDDLDERVANRLIDRRVCMPFGIKAPRYVMRMKRN